MGTPPIHSWLHPAPSTASSSVVPIPGTFSWPLAARGKPRRGMLRRAVFSDVQRKALEKMFQKQKYISKPDRKKLAAKLGLKDSQVSASPPKLPFLSIICLGGSIVQMDKVRPKLASSAWVRPRRPTLFPSTINWDQHPKLSA